MRFGTAVRANPGRAWGRHLAACVQLRSGGQRSRPQRKVQQRIERQDQRFLLGNLLTAIAFLGILIFAVFVRLQSSWMGTGWAPGICVLVLVFLSAGYRVWVMQGMWAS
jgi:hypothetical protein